MQPLAVVEQQITALHGGIIHADLVHLLSRETLDLVDGVYDVDPQRVFDVARDAGDVLGFGPVQLSLGELFREVVA